MWWIGVALAATWEVELEGPVGGVLPPGERASLVFRWTNDGEVPARVPSAPWRDLTVHGDHRAPGERGPLRGYGVGHRIGRADEIAWSTVLPGETVTRVVELGLLVAPCADGCPAGAWTLSGAPAVVREDIAGDQLTPRAGFAFDFVVRGASRPATADEVEVRARHAPHGITLVVRNTSAGTLWVAPAWIGDCAVRGRGGADEVQRHAAGGQAPFWSEADGAALRPGARIRLPTGCAVDAGAQEATGELRALSRVWVSEPHAGPLPVVEGPLAWRWSR